MKEENKNVYEAKKSLKSHIKFLESLLSHLNSTNEVNKGRAMWATWCLHQYFEFKFIQDIEQAMSEHIKKDTH